MTSDTTPSTKPRVVALGDPKYVGHDFLADFRKDFDVDVLEATNRAETQAMLPGMVAARPIDAFVIRMGTPAYEPFDEDLLGALVPHCKIITSASAGFVSQVPIPKRKARECVFRSWPPCVFPVFMSEQKADAVNPWYHGIVVSMNLFGVFRVQGRGRPGAPVSTSLPMLVFFFHFRYTQCQKGEGSWACYGG